MRESVERLRTSEALLRKNEQIQDAIERGAISPKTAEQMSQCVKTPIMLARLELSYMKMLSTMGRKAAVPRSPLVRSMVGLDPERIGPGDGAAVRALAGEN